MDKKYSQYCAGKFCLSRHIHVRVNINQGKKVNRKMKKWPRQKGIFGLK